MTEPLPARPGPNSGKLSADQLDDYHARGFTVVPDVFTPGELATIDDEIDRILPEHEDRAGHRPGWILGLSGRSQVALRLARDDRTLALVEDIVRPGIAIHSAKLVAKVPGSPIICHWHQDEAFYRRPTDPATHSRTRMSVWIPLHDAEEENGCLWVVPGSHAWGLQPFTLVDSGQCRRRLTRKEYADRHAIPVPVPAGSVVLFSAWTWHHSKVNTTDRVRRAVIVSYQEATVGSSSAEWRLLRPAGDDARAAAG